MMRYGGVWLGQYDVFFMNVKTGVATVVESKLYYCIDVNCSGLDDDFYRLRLISDNNDVDLGICLRNKSGLYLKTKVPIKKVGKPILKFVLNKKTDDRHILLYDDMCFIEFPNLEHCTVQMCDDGLYLLLGICGIL